MRVINLFGAPGSGKSTTRAGLFFLMKCAGIRCEEAHEAAKLPTYEGNFAYLANQGLVTADQDRNIRSVGSQVDWVVTDSPLLLGLLYAPGTAFDNVCYRQAVWSLFNGYDNVNVYIERVKPYQPYGRSQTEDEARVLDKRLRSIVGDHIDLHVPGDTEAPQRIFDFLGLPQSLAA